MRCGDQLYKVGDGAFLPNDAFEFKYEPSRPPVMYIDDVSLLSLCSFISILKSTVLLERRPENLH